MDSDIIGRREEQFADAGDAFGVGRALDVRRAVGAIFAGIDGAVATKRLALIGDAVRVEVAA